MSPTNERRGGARYQVPNRKEVDPTKLWTVALLAAAAWIARLSVEVLSRRAYF